MVLVCAMMGVSSIQQHVLPSTPYRYESWLWSMLQLTDIICCIASFPSKGAVLLWALQHFVAVVFSCAACASIYRTARRHGIQLAIAQYCTQWCAGDGICLGAAGLRAARCVFTWRSSQVSRWPRARQWLSLQSCTYATCVHVYSSTRLRRVELQDGCSALCSKTTQCALPHAVFFDRAWL